MISASTRCPNDTKAGSPGLSQPPSIARVASLPGSPFSLTAHLPVLHLPRWITGIAAALLLCAGASLAHAQVYKCTDDAGKTTYADTPCDSGSKPLKLPDPGKQSTTDPHLCAQLLDELNRLAADADRNAQQGRTESSSSVKRRQSLTRQYEARCVGIARSAPKPK